MLSITSQCTERLRCEGATFQAIAARCKEAAEIAAWTKDPVLTAKLAGHSFASDFVVRTSIMDVSSFLAGNFLTHLDLPQSLQTWTISKADQQLVGSDQKVCITFAEFPAKPLGLNKTNLRRIAELHGVDASQWAGKQVQVYRSTTQYSGKVMQCVRVCGPQQAPPEAVCDSQGNTVPPASLQAQPVAQQPVAVPQQPVTAVPQQATAATPWEADATAIQQNNPPNA